MKNIFKSLKKSFLRERCPTFFGFIERRLSLVNPYGLYFSAGIALSAFFFILFLGIVQNVLSKDWIVETDACFMNLIASLRTVTLAKFFLFFTYLGNWQFITSLSAIIAIILFLLKERRKLVFFLTGVVGGEVLYYSLKLLFHRARPDAIFSLIIKDGYSFPSGHATMSFLFYGIVAYALFYLLKKNWQKIFLIISFSVFIFLIGFSRIYLGVHWVSDILAGWVFGAGLLVLLITFFKERERFKPETKK
ncbi:MAG: phosphatase PAP2 family protein [Candidatus Marinimicrobia bacterium]|nr:phosphatase PAP2 family protein [Candidatus Neomarinimicrobiota bacterium]